MTQQTINSKASKYNLPAFVVEDIAEDIETAEELDYALASYKEFIPDYEEVYSPSTDYLV